MFGICQNLPVYQHLPAECWCQNNVKIKQFYRLPTSPVKLPLPPSLMLANGHIEQHLEASVWMWFMSCFLCPPKSWGLLPDMISAQWLSLDLQSVRLCLFLVRWLPAAGFRMLALSHCVAHEATFRERAFNNSKEITCRVNHWLCFLQFICRWQRCLLSSQNWLCNPHKFWDRYIQTSH